MTTYNSTYILHITTIIILWIVFTSQLAEIKTSLWNEIKYAIQKNVKENICQSRLFYVFFILGGAWQNILKVFVFDIRWLRQHKVIQGRRRSTIYNDFYYFLWKILVRIFGWGIFMRKDLNAWMKKKENNLNNFKCYN